MKKLVPVSSQTDSGAVDISYLMTCWDDTVVKWCPNRGALRVRSCDAVVTQSGSSVPAFQNMKTRPPQCPEPITQPSPPMGRVLGLDLGPINGLWAEDESPPGH